MESTLPSFWHLRVFETVARLESVSRASQELLRSQPAVTKSIVKLESVLGVTLFDRATTGTYPTAAGVAVLVRARKILAAAEQAVLEIADRPVAQPLAVATAITRAHMRAVIAIAEAKSFYGAAGLLAISEASLQRAARQLEQNVGCKLYRNTAAGVATTKAGTELARRLSLIGGQIEALVADVERFKHAEQTVVVGVLLLDPTILLTRAIRELSETFENAKVVVVSGGYDALLKKLHANNIDFIIGILKRPDYDAEAKEEALYQDRYCVVARNGHPLAKGGVVSLKGLREYDWILPQHGSPRRLAFEQIFLDGPSPRAKVETYSLSTIRLTLAESNALTVLSWTEALCEQRIGLLAPLNFEVPPPGPVIGLTTRREWEPTAVQAAFVDALRKASRELLLR
ncbi:MAG TPA: LysR family transcriptional regulator [Caulobacteraceae bacterium]|nr:LysR family transcriptional regulator [Caulobacteraceae bacterium]